ncbi:cytochrome P450 [Immersiella caudata]|uniref:Cytochrome P450 n=1 Tax=Immersiella caudata TaxID=314043 RepID=A0AA39WJF8_9PEZI|nr:cytochrome P450 [Immersiella caudata]
MSLDSTTWTFKDAALPALATAALLWYLSTTLTSYFRLRNIPGPPLASLSYLWILLKMQSRQMHRIAISTQRRYGPIVRIGPNEVLVYDPETLWHINAPRSGYGRGGWYEGMRFDPYGHNLFSEPDTALHDARKAQISAAFTARGGIDFEGVVNAHVAVLVDLLERKYAGNSGSGKAMDFGITVKYFSTDVTTHACLGKPWGDLPTETDMFHFIEDADAFTPFMHCVGVVPFLRSFFASRAFLFVAGPKVTDKRGLGQFLGEANREVEKRFRDGAKGRSYQRDMLDDWIKRGLTPAECRREAALQVPAGTETISTIIRGTMLYLLTSPLVYRKLKDEIAAAIKSGRISSPVTNDEAKQLPYLQAVLNEGMRMVPATTIGFSKRVPKGGDTICGKFVPGGTDVMVNFCEMVRNRKVFGEDADAFRPERFLECDDVMRSRMLKVVDLSFGHGRWMCVGKALAWMELNKLFVELLRKFDFQIVNPEEPWECHSTTSFHIEKFWIRVVDAPVDDT